MVDNIQNNLGDLSGEPPTSDQEIIKEIDVDNEKQYLKEIKKKNKGFLVEGMTLKERERIAQHICSLFEKNKSKHNDRCEEIDEDDETYRMERKEIIGSDGTLPNYQSPLSTVALETLHSMMLNVFFTPKDLARALPMEEGDIPKIGKLNTFMNWSVDNELKAFENLDRLFHSSGKNGECPYLMHWVKEYGTEIVRNMVRNPADPTEPLYDPDTKEPLYQEVEEQKLLYNGPKLEVFSRKDYFQPENAVMGKTPEWEGMATRLSYDQYLREELQGKMYFGSIKDVQDWDNEGQDVKRVDFDGDSIPLGPWNQDFRTFYGRLRINIVKENDEDDTVEIEELEDEYIAIVHVPTQTLCQLRKNKFPLKKRPIGLDILIPDDEGRRKGIGVMRFMRSQQRSYDVLWNQYIFGVMQANNPIIFYEPTGNQRDEPTKLKNGYMYPTSNAGSIKIVQLPGPTTDLNVALELVQQWAQSLFGISDYLAGQESTIDPDASGKKVESIVARGQVRSNALVKRKNATIKDILERWFLLYKENLPPNRYMRIAGHSEDKPWKFEKMTLSDFSLKSIPDFELVGNVLNSNKTLEINKAIAVYNILSQNMLFAPQTQQGQQRYLQLTKWLVDKLDEMGLVNFLPDAPGDNVITPEEENARFLQGDMGEATIGEDHMNHLKVHQAYMNDPNTPDQMREPIIAHIQTHLDRIKELLTQQVALQQTGIQPGQPGQPGGQGGQPGVQGQAGQAGQVVSG